MTTQDKKKYFKADKNIFKKLKFKLYFSPFGRKKCCCGFTNCIDIDCLTSLPTE